MYIDLAGRRVKSVGYPESSGTLCEPTQPGTISDTRSYLEGGQSLLAYNEARGGIRRKRLAAADDPEAQTVGLRTSKDSIFDFPPQILDPVFYVTTQTAGPEPSSQGRSTQRGQGSTPHNYMMCYL